MQNRPLGSKPSIGGVVSLNSHETTTQKSSCHKQTTRMDTVNWGDSSTEQSWYRYSIIELWQTNPYDGVNGYLCWENVSLIIVMVSCGQQYLDSPSRSHSRSMPLTTSTKGQKRVLPKISAWARFSHLPSVVNWIPSYQQLGWGLNLLRFAAIQLDRLIKREKAKRVSFFQWKLR